MDIGKILECAFTKNKYMAAMLVDSRGKVLSVSDTYLKVLNMDATEVVGKQVREITPHTKVYTVLKTGKAIVGYNWKVNEYNMIASTIPIYHNNEVAGAFAYSVFLDIWHAQDTIHNLLSELNMYKDEIDNLYQARYNFNDIIGQDELLKRVKRFAQQVSNHSITTVLICGDSGTGKELFAHAIHNNSSRRYSPFLRINCAAIPENLLEAELFGYEEGAYTGAKKGGKPGKFELANGGTIFLDEIGEMSLTMQSKLLVVLQEQEIERLGSHYPIRINVRVIAATNRNLEQMVAQNQFREDLYYRLNVVRLNVPPLKKRRGDIPLLSRHIISQLNMHLNTAISEISAGGLDILYGYSWPGNIRELENVLERALIVADMEKAETLQERHLAFLNHQVDIKVSPRQKSLKAALAEVEYEMIQKALQENEHDRTLAADKLGIDVSTLYKKIKKYKISVK